MSEHTSVIPADGSMSPKAWYQAASEQPGFVYDAAQAEAINQLDMLWQSGATPRNDALHEMTNNNSNALIINRSF